MDFKWRRDKSSRESQNKAKDTGSTHINKRQKSTIKRQDKDKYK